MSRPAARWSPWIIGSFVALATYWGLPAAAAGPPPTVTAIEVRADVPMSDEDLRQRIALEVGQPLDEERVVRTLRELEGAGWGADVEILTRPVGDLPNAVVAVVVLRGSTRVVRIGFEGAGRSIRTQLRRALALQVGDFLDPSEVAGSVTALEALYKERGYPMVQVEGVVVSLRRREAAVRFIVRPGARTVVSRVDFEPRFWEGSSGARELETASRRSLDFAVGDAYSLGRSREAAERLEARLHQLGYRLARVDNPRVEGDSSAGSVGVIFPVEVGPRIVIEVSGAGRAQVGKRPVELGEAEGYDEALVQQLVTRLERRLQEHGYHSGSVTPRETRSSDEIHLVLEVEAGPKTTLAEVRFEGNEAVSDDQLRTLVSVSSKRLLQPSSGRLIDELVDDDLANIRSYYALQGYGAARVGPVRIERTAESESGKEVELTLVVPIEEGPRSEVAALSLVGTEALAEEVGERAIAERIGLEKGGPFHAVLLQNAVDGLSALYDERGFEGTEIDARVSWPSEFAAEVDILAREGMPIVLDRVSVRGRGRTAAGVIERLVGLSEGDRVTTLKLLEAQRRLYALGTFSRADLELLKTGELSDQQDLIVTVREAAARRLSYAVGYDSDEGLRGQLGWVNSNLFGRAISWQTDVRLSEDQEQFRTLLSQPFLGRFPVIISYAGFSLEQARPAYLSKQLGNQLQADYVSANRRFSLLYGYRNVDLDEERPALPTDEPIPREAQSVQISSLTPSLFLDRRDDPIDPRRGWSALLSVESAFPLASAQEEFAKTFAQFTWLRPLGRAIVLATSFRIGVIEAFADESAPDLSLPAHLEAREVPISERFFAGGRTTHRAYRLDFLGIRGETLCGEVQEVRSDADLCRADAPLGSYLPVGGDGLALVNIDLRFPIVGPLDGVFFVDGGNVWSAASDIDGSDFKWGAGFGIRYRSPIGPLRAEIGWKLDRLPGEDAYEFAISFGNPF